MSVSKVRHAGTHVVAHIIIPWLLRGAVAIAVPIVGSVGLNIGPVAHLLHVEESAPVPVAVQTTCH